MTQTSPAKALFLAARDIADAGERRRFVETSCGGDAGLRERVEALLSASEGAADFLTETVEVERGLQPSLGERIGYFGDYVLLDEIARGASGVVFRARQSSLDRVVALKMLRGHALAEGDDGLRRFKAEAQAAAGLKHAHLVPIYEVGEFEGQGYYSMPLIEGGTLISRAGEYREPRKAVALMVKVARAIQAAHEAGLLHRDIKPGNVLIDAEGEPQVTDFGIARKMGMDSDLTVTGQIMGTPHYMSPEQARGETQGLTAAADVYGLGAVLYELLTGEKPFSGDSMIEVLKKVVEEPPKAPQGIERDLGVIVMKCLEKAPGDRYGSAAALADDLERWQRGEPISAREAGVAERVVKWVRRRPSKAAMGVLGGVCVALAAWVVFEPEPGFDPGAGFVKAKRGEPVDLLALMKPPYDVYGTWSQKEGALVSTPVMGGTKSLRVPVALPVRATGGYDLRTEFSVDGSGIIKGGDGPIWLVCAGEARFQVVMITTNGCQCPECLKGGKGKPVASTAKVPHPLGAVSGLYLIQGKNAVTNGTGVFRHRVPAGQKQVMELRVRLLAGDEVNVQVRLNGRKLIDWSGPRSDLSQNAASSKVTPPFSVHLVGGFRRALRCHAMTFTPVSGESWKGVR